MLSNVFPEDGPYPEWDRVRSYRLSNIEVFFPISLLSNPYPTSSKGKAKEWPTTREVFEVDGEAESGAVGAAAAVSFQWRRRRWVSYPLDLSISILLYLSISFISHAYAHAHAHAHNLIRAPILQAAAADEAKLKGVKVVNESAKIWVRIPLEKTLAEVLASRAYVMPHVPVLHVVARRTPFYKAFEEANTIKEME